MIDTAKKYDYWLIVWTNHNDEEVHDLAPFQVGIHPSEWCEAIMDSRRGHEVRTSKFKAIKNPYKGYRLFKITAMEEEIVKS